MELVEKATKFVKLRRIDVPNIYQRTTKNFWNQNQLELFKNYVAFCGTSSSL